MRKVLLCLAMMGCATPVVNTAPPVTVITIAPIPPEELPRTYGQIIEVEIDTISHDGKPIKTWLSKEEVEAAKKAAACNCLQGDPLCDCP